MEKHIFHAIFQHFHGFACFLFLMACLCHLYRYSQKRKNIFRKKKTNLHWIWPFTYKCCFSKSQPKNVLAGFDVVARTKFLCFHYLKRCQSENSSPLWMPMKIYQGFLKWTLLFSQFRNSESFGIMPSLNLMG